jgi:glycerate kinase
VGFRDRLREVDLVLTGEGRLDAQSLRGKTAVGVAAASREAGVPVVVFCGRADVDLPGATVVSMADVVGPGRAIREAGPSLEELAEKVASSLVGRGGQVGSQAGVTP